MALFYARSEFGWPRQVLRKNPIFHGLHPSYTTNPYFKYDYCDCSGNGHSISPRDVCGTITRPISFDFDRYNSQASVIPTVGRNKDKIIGGDDANPGEIPWQVNILIDGTWLDNLICGGTLVSESVRS